MNKKAYVLFLTLIIVVIFSVVSLNYFQIKSLKTENIKSQIVYIQAQNHMDFLEDISKEYDFISKFEIQNNDFEIYAIKENSEIHYFVKSKKDEVNIHKSKDLEATLK